MALATGLEIEWPAFLKAHGSGSRAINDRLREILLKHTGSLERKIRSRAPHNRGTLANAISVRLKGTTDSYIIEVYVSGRGDSNTPSPLEYYLQREFGGPIEPGRWMGFAPSDSPIFGKRISGNDIHDGDFGFKKIFSRPLKTGGRGLFGFRAEEYAKHSGKSELLMVFKQMVDQRSYQPDGRFIMPSIREQEEIIAGEIRRRFKEIVFG